jgi:hypothetical protein
VCTSYIDRRRHYIGAGTHAHCLEALGIHMMYYANAGSEILTSGQLCVGPIKEMME